MKDEQARMEAEGFVVLTLEFHKEDDVWLGRCKELGTSTFADTLEEVTEELRELIALHLNGLEQAGEIGRFFSEHGIKYYTLPLRTVQSEIPLDQDEFIQVKSFPLRSHPTGITASVA